MNCASVLPLAIALTLPLSGDPADDYVNFIRQIQADGTGEWDISNLESSGEAVSYEGVGEDGSDFELWSIYSPSGDYYLLDTQFVAAYAPSATITIETADPYPTIKRTRADQGYTLRVTLSGLVDPENVTDETPAAAQQAIFKHETYLFPDGVLTLEGQSIVPEVFEQTYISGNGPYPASPGYIVYETTMIPSNDLRYTSGEEHFSVTALADFGVEEAEIEQQKIQIWPRATASINGLDGQAYYTTVPPISIDLVDLYPTSKTWLRVYPGRWNASPNSGDIVDLWATALLVNDAVPRSASQAFGELDEFLTAEGWHTLEVVHETPWGLESLTYQEFQVDRTVEFKGNIISK